MSEQNAAPKAAASLFGRIFGQDLFNAALLIGLVWAIGRPMLVPSELVKDSDLWWHLADARLLTTTHHFIRVEPYSFAVAGERWINPEWLAELPYWWSYSSLGLRGIHLAALLGLAANLLFLYFRSLWKTQSRKAAFWTAVLAFFLMTVNGGARTIVIAYLALSAEMAILETAERGKTRLLWLLPALFCLWINLHGSWLIGLGYFGLYVVCGLFPLNVGALEQRAFSAADRNRLIGAFAASAAALWVNPYGWRLIWNPFDMLFYQRLNLAVVEEWHPLSMSSSTGIAAAAAIGLTLAANLVRGRKWKLYELAFIFSAWVLAFSHQRFAFLACVVTIPWLAADVARSFYGELSETTIPAINAIFAAVIFGWCVYSFPTEAELQRDLAAGMPLQSIASIQPSWRTFNNYSLGGRMAFDSKPSFLDSRVDTFEHHGVLQQYLAVESLSDPKTLLDANRIDHVLTRADGALAFALDHSPGWRVALREGAGDKAYEMFERTAVP